MNLLWKKAAPAARTAPPARQLVRIGHQEFIRAVQALPQYDSLQRQIGRWADVTLEAMYAGLARGKPHIEAFDKAGIWASAANLLQLEIDRVGNSGRFIVAQFQRARTVGFDLRRHAMAPAEYGRVQHDSELDAAVRWIVSASNTMRGAQPLGHASPHLQLQRAMLVVILQMDVRDVRTLHRLHAAAVEQPAVVASRGIVSDRSVKYCSSGGAGHLQDGIGDYAMSIPKPAEGDPAWDDIACFLLGVHMRAHGFADGNGRAVRCLYACTLLQGGREFVAPTTDLENRLHDL